MGVIRRSVVRESFGIFDLSVSIISHEFTPFAIHALTVVNISTAPPVAKAKCLTDLVAKTLPGAFALSIDVTYGMLGSRATLGSESEGDKGSTGMGTGGERDYRVDAYQEVLCYVLRERSRGGACRVLRRAAGFPL